jgi:hypothetical protein
MYGIQSDGNLFVSGPVVVKGLKDGAAYNGLKGTLLHLHEDSQRWSVRVEASPTKVLLIKSKNLSVDEDMCQQMYGSKENFIMLMKANQQRHVDMNRAHEETKAVHAAALNGLTAPAVSWLRLSESNGVRLGFSQLHKLWAKCGERFTQWFDNLPDDEACLEASMAKTLFINCGNSAGKRLSTHVPNPAGISPDDICLLPELHTRGPSFVGQPPDAMRAELAAARALPALLRARADPACLAADVAHCRRLRAAGRLPHFSSDGADEYGGRARAFAARGRAAAALDPRAVPDAILLGLDPAGRRAAAARAVAEFVAGLGEEAEVVEGVEPPVYVAALHRLDSLTGLAVSVLNDFR